MWKALRSYVVDQGMLLGARLAMEQVARRFEESFRCAEFAETRHALQVLRFSSRLEFKVESKSLAPIDLTAIEESGVDNKCCESPCVALLANFAPAPIQPGDAFHPYFPCLPCTFRSCPRFNCQHTKLEAVHIKLYYA